MLRSVRAGRLRPRRVPGPDAARWALSWIGDERIAISGVPPPTTVARLAEQGVTHVVNCRPRADVWWTGDLAAERAAFGPGPVAQHQRRRPGAVVPAQPQHRVSEHDRTVPARGAVDEHFRLRLII